MKTIKFKTLDKLKLYYHIFNDPFYKHLETVGILVHNTKIFHIKHLTYIKYLNYEELYGYFLGWMYENYSPTDISNLIINVIKIKYKNDGWEDLIATENAMLGQFSIIEIIDNAIILTENDLSKLNDELYKEIESKLS